MNGQISIYRYSRLTCYWSGLVGVILIAMFGVFFLKSGSTVQRLLYGLVDGLLALGTVVSVSAMNRYRVILEGDRVSIGVSNTKSFLLADVVALSTIPLRVPLGVVTLKNGERVTIGHVEDFKELMNVLRERTGIRKSYLND